MSQLYPPLDDALGGVGDAFAGIGETTGDAAGGLIGGVFAPFESFLLKMAALGLAAYVLVKVVA